MNQISTKTTQTMSSLEIAELTGKRHDNVVADIRRVLNEVEIDATEFSVTQKYGRNNDREIFNLPFRETNLIVAGYSAKHRLVIIDRWQELEAVIAQPVITADKPIDWIGFGKTFIVGIKLGLAQGMTQAQANLFADDFANKHHGISILDDTNTRSRWEESEIVKPLRNGLVLIPRNEKFITATEVGEIVSMTAQNVNRTLSDMGLLKGKPGGWSLTEEGKRYGRYYEYNGVVVRHQIRWSEATGEKINNHLSELKAA